MHSAISAWTDELNGLSDSPVILPDGQMQSTANFDTMALALSLDQVPRALLRVAELSVQRIQRLMNPDLTGLARYLSPIGGASAGMVPMQKTAAALLARMQADCLAMPLSPAPVSDGVEDHAPLTPIHAEKLARGVQSLRLLSAIEALVAAQAIHLRQPTALSAMATSALKAIRSVSAPLEQDRSLGPDIEPVAQALEKLIHGMDEFNLATH